MAACGYGLLVGRLRCSGVTRAAEGKNVVHILFSMGGGIRGGGSCRTGARSGVDGRTSFAIAFASAALTARGTCRRPCTRK